MLNYLESRQLLRLACTTLILFLLACTPRFDWREVRGSNAPFVALLPAKASTHTREIDLDGRQVSMTMTGARVDDITFAVGAIQWPDPASAPQALQAMKQALVNNIAGTITRERIIEASERAPIVEIEASGSIPARGERAPEKLLLAARFTAQGGRLYQAVVVGPEGALSREEIDTFLTGFSVQ